MSESRATGWPSDAPTAAQVKELFAQIESGRITKEGLQAFLRPKPDPYEYMRNFPIEDLQFLVRTYNVLKRVGIETIGDLTDKTEDQLRQIPNFNPHKELTEIRDRLAEHGLALKGELTPAQPGEHQEPMPEWQPPVTKLYELIKLNGYMTETVLQIVLRAAVPELREGKGEIPELKTAIDKLNVNIDQLKAEFNALVPTGRKDDPDAY